MALKKLTLLHSNDLHGDFLAEQVDESLIGGVSMLSGYVQKVRAEEENVIYAIAGDMFRGSPIDSEYRGVSTIELMNILGPDVVTIGNHEVDYGIPQLLFLEKCATFPLLNGNVSVGPLKKRLLKSHKFFEIDGMRVLFIGLLTESTLKSMNEDKLVGSYMQIDDPILEVEKICTYYAGQDIDLTVLLTHIGWDEDIALARRLDPEWGVDVIIGGHSHTVPEAPACENGVLIVQAGIGTDQIGRFDLLVDTDSNTVADWQWACLPITSETCPRDKRMEEAVAWLKGETDLKFDRHLCTLSRKVGNAPRYRESEVGNLLCDVLQKAFVADIALLNSASFRGESLGPRVTLGELTVMFPYNGPLSVINLTGAQIKALFSHMLAKDNIVSMKLVYYQVSSNVRVVYDALEEKLQSVELYRMPVIEDALYTVVVQDYSLQDTQRSFGIALEDIEANGRIRRCPFGAMDVFMDVLPDSENLGASVEGRVTVLNWDAYVAYAKERGF